MPRVLALAPHTDDAEFGCGGSLARYAEEGAEVVVLALSDAWQQLPPGFPRDTLPKEAAAACAALGAGITSRVRTYPVRRIGEHRQRLLDELTEWATQWQPTIVFTPSLHDVHQDHQAVTAEAVRAFKRTTLLGYELAWNCPNFDRDLYVRLSAEHVERKLSAIRCYASQAGKTYSDTAYWRGLARARGVECGHRQAEAFEVYRMVV